MDIILLENIRKLGNFGSKVKVRKGYARNFLIPQGKAVPANAANLAKFEAQREDFQRAADLKREQAQERAGEIQAVHLMIHARSADEGKLYGSVGTQEIAEAFKKHNIDVKRQEVRLPNGAFRELGDYEVDVHLHAEVNAKAKISIVAEAK
jgi:large subunit ribosomal protein L9